MVGTATSTATTTKGLSPNLYVFSWFFFSSSFTYNFFISTLDYYNIARFNNEWPPPTSGPPLRHVTTPLCYHHHYNCHFSHHHHDEHDEEGNDGNRGSVLQYSMFFFHFFVYFANFFLQIDYEWQHQQQYKWWQQWWQRARDAVVSRAPGKFSFFLFLSLIHICSD